MCLIFYRKCFLTILCTMLCRGLLFSQTDPPAPAPPTANNPADNATGIGIININLKWNKTATHQPSGYKTQYYVELSNFDNFVPLLQNSGWIQSTSNTISFRISTRQSPLCSNTDYYWRVKARFVNNKDETKIIMGDFSATFKFTTNEPDRAWYSLEIKHNYASSLKKVFVGSTNSSKPMGTIAISDIVGQLKGAIPRFSSCYFKPDGMNITLGNVSTKMYGYLFSSTASTPSNTPRKIGFQIKRDAVEYVSCEGYWLDNSNVVMSKFPVSGMTFIRICYPTGNIQEQVPTQPIAISSDAYVSIVLASTISESVIITDVEWDTLSSVVLTDSLNYDLNTNWKPILSSAIVSPGDSLTLSGIPALPLGIYVFRLKAAYESTPNDVVLSTYQFAPPELVPPSEVIPTLSEWGLIVFGIVLSLTLFLLMRKRLENHGQPII